MPKLLPKLNPGEAKTIWQSLAVTALVVLCATIIINLFLQEAHAIGLVLLVALAYGYGVWHANIYLTARQAQDPVLEWERDGAEE